MMAGNDVVSYGSTGVRIPESNNCLYAKGYYYYIYIYIKDTLFAVYLETSNAVVGITTTGSFYKVSLRDQSLSESAPLK